MPDRVMKVIPELKEGGRSVIQLTRDYPLFIGEGDLNFICGTCSKILLKNLEDGQAGNMVFVCFICGAFNEAP
jgi:DNA-directed RNA polymerase subunit RPC12/RpoP